MGEEDLCHVSSGGCSLTNVPSVGIGEKRGICAMWGMLSDTCPQWRMLEERMILAMYAVGDPQ